MICTYGQTTRTGTREEEMYYRQPCICLKPNLLQSYIHATIPTARLPLGTNLRTAPRTQHVVEMGVGEAVQAYVDIWVPTFKRQASALLCFSVGRFRRTPRLNSRMSAWPLFCFFNHCEDGGSH